MSEITLKNLKDILILLIAVFVVVMIIGLGLVLSEAEDIIGSDGDIASSFANVKNKLTEIVKPIDEPDISVRASKVDSKYLYEVRVASFEALYNPEAGLDWVVPVVYYKGEQSTAESIHIIGAGHSRPPIDLVTGFDPNQPTEAVETSLIKIPFDNIEFVIESSKPCTKKSEDCKKTDNPFVCEVLENQDVAFENHLVKVLALSSGFIGGFIGRGDCRVAIMIRCKDGQKSNIKLGECDSSFDCQANYDLCGNNVNLKVNDLDCVEKTTELEIMISGRNEESWLVEDELYIGFWKYNNDEDIANCWEFGFPDILNKECIEQLVGLYKYNVPLGSFNNRAC